MNLLEAVTTDDLIAELTSRKRILALCYATNYFNKFAEDEGYMRSLEADMVQRIARALNNKLCIPFEDTTLERDEAGRPTKTTRRASVTVLVPEGVDDDGGSS